MKTFFTLLLLFLLSSLNPVSAIVYTTTAAGNIDADIWSPSNPPLTLPFGDEMVINHAVNLNKDLKIYGKLTISNGASLIGTKNMKIGDGSTTGEMVNNGTVDVADLKVKGDDSVENLTAPSLTNNSSITVESMHVGDNSGAGILTNNVGATITVNGELHLDNILDNKGTMTITGTLKDHGGTVKGGGKITNCKIEFDINNTRPGKLLDQNICCDFGILDQPEYKIKGGATYSSLASFIAIEGSSSPDHLIDIVDYFSCNVNAGGALPVELISFRARENSQHYAELSWSTESETNNKYFAIERSINGRNFDALGVVMGAGTSTQLQTYTFVDKAPATVAYYRLKQVDLDGSFQFSNVIVLEMKSFQPNRIEAYPTMTENEITIRFNSFDTQKSLFKIVNSRGKLMYDEEVLSSSQLEYRTLDLSQYDNGIYHVILSDGFNYRTTKFVVMKAY